MKIVSIILASVAFMQICSAGEEAKEAAVQKEKQELIKKALHAIDMITVDLKGNRKIPRDRKPPGYWSKEVERLQAELIKKGYFVKKVGKIPSSKFKEYFKNLTGNPEDDKMLFFTSSPYEPEKTNRTINFIGPPEIVEKAMKRLNKINKQPKKNSNK